MWVSWRVLLQKSFLVRITGPVTTPPLWWIANLQSHPGRKSFLARLPVFVFVSNLSAMVTGHGISTNPSEKYAQVKLDHFPKIEVNLSGPSYPVGPRIHLYSKRGEITPKVITRSVKPHWFSAIYRGLCIHLQLGGAHLVYILSL